MDPFEAMPAPVFHPAEGDDFGGEIRSAGVPRASSEPVSLVSASQPVAVEAQLPEDQVFDELMTLLSEQGRPAADLDRVRAAFEFARQMHTGQRRKNGDNYIVHPVSVALSLARIPVDTDTVLAALLHDVVEDTPATADDLNQRFGPEVTKLVEGVTKLGKVAFTSLEDRQAENFRRMFLAMAEDVRVVLLKLADRQHNMQTLCYLKPEKQAKIAKETLEIFAPLANRMGMGKIRAELEDRCLQVLQPDDYRAIEAELADTQSERQEGLTEVVQRIQEQLARIGVQARVYGRMKNYYSIYKKMQARQKPMQEIFDISAIRIIVGSETECYEALGVIHNTYTPIPGRFKDYIAMPKSNLYQSLHTTVMGKAGRPMEVQIRTHEMHRIAEYGIAAHWKYKESGAPTDASSTDDQKLSWLKLMLEMKDETDDARDYVDSVKLDLFRDEVFVFTPKGQVVDLPKGSTPVDFAYRIHTEIGHRCTGSLVNGRIVPLNHILRNGDIVEVLTGKKAAPRLDWIKFVQTHQAKTRIRQWYKHHFREEHIAQGRSLLEAELTRTVVEEAQKSGRLLTIAQSLNYTSVEDLFLAVGYGELNPPKVLNRLKTEAQTPSQPLQQQMKRVPQVKHNKGQADITGLKGMLHHMAKCCTPVPGDNIIGVVTRSRGVMVHREDCDNLAHVNPDRQMWVSWEGESAPQKTHTVRLEVQAFDRLGVFKDILTHIADAHTNLSSAKVKVSADHTALIELAVDIRNLEHLEALKAAILRVPDVITIKRQVMRPTVNGKSAEGLD